MSTTQFAPQLRPLSVGEILDASFKVVRQSFGTLAVCVLVVALPLNIVRTLIEASTRDNAFNLDVATNNVSSGTQAAGGLLIAILSILLTSIAAAACFRAVSSVYLGETPTVGGSLSFAANKVLSVVWLSILFGFGLIIPLLFFLLPGIWLAVAWSVAFPVLLSEGLGGGKALGRSFRLVKGRWWSTFGTLIVMYLIVLVISLIVGGLLGTALVASQDSEAVAGVLTTIINTVSSLITLPLYAAVLTILYYDLRVRKEGFDLHLLARGVGSDATSPQNVAASSGLGGFDPPAGGGFAPPQAPSSTPPPGGLQSGDPLAPPPERREDDGGTSS
jgi:Membrane domain of glycerophosphoryl diester phosphodiesterase